MSPGHGFFRRYAVRAEAADPRERYLLHFMGDWASHTESYLDQDRVLTLRYEDLLEDPRRELARLLTHLGIGWVAADAIGRVLAQGAEDLAAKRQRHDRPRARSGLWRETYNEEQKSQAWQRFGETLERLGYPAS